MFIYCRRARDRTNGASVFAGLVRAAIAVLGGLVVVWLKADVTWNFVAVALGMVAFGVFASPPLFTRSALSKAYSIGDRSKRRTVVVRPSRRRLSGWRRRDSWRAGAAPQYERLVEIRLTQKGVTYTRKRRCLIDALLRHSGFDVPADDRAEQTRSKLRQGMRQATGERPEAMDRESCSFIAITSSRARRDPVFTREMVTPLRRSVVAFRGTTWSCNTR